MKKNIVKINEQQLKKIVAESVKKVLKERIGNDLDSFYNYVVNKFNQEHIEIGDAGDVEELYQGCSNYNYETEPFDKLYQKVKNDWLQYKSEQQNDIVAESVKKVLKEESPRKVRVQIYDYNENAKELPLNEEEYEIYKYINDNWGRFMQTKVLRAYPTYISYIEAMAEKTIVDGYNNTEHEQYLFVPQYFDRFWKEFQNSYEIEPQNMKRLGKKFEIIFKSGLAEEFCSFLNERGGV